MHMRIFMELVNSTAFPLFAVRDVWMNEIYVPKDGSVFRDLFFSINIQRHLIYNQLRRNLTFL